MPNNITSIGNRAQLVGLGTSTFDVQAMLQLEIDILNARKNPYYNQIKNLETEKNAWDAFRMSLKNFNSRVEKVMNFDQLNKSVKLGANGFFTVIASSEALEGRYDIAIEQIASAHRISSDTYEGEVGINETVQINGKDLDITEEMTVRDIALKINNGDYGVSAIVLDNRLVLTSKQTGKSGEITISDSSVFELIGLIDSGIIKNELNKGQNAIFTINGIKMESENNVVNELEGITITLTKPTESQIEFSVEQSMEEIIKLTEEMIDGYNSLMQAIKSLSGEKGILQGEIIPMRIKTELGNIISNTIINGKTLNTIGISFDRSAGDGLIELNKEKLKEFFKTNPKEVIEMLAGESGIGTRIFNVVDNFVKESGSIEGEIESLDNRIERINKNIERMDEEFERNKEMLLMKYATLDVMMSQMKILQNFISAQLLQFEIDGKK